MIKIDIIRKQIDMWDPIDLFDLHCPPDEYESEIEEIFKIASNKELDSNILGKIIFDVFKEAFASAFERTIEECILIAEKILNY